MASTAILQTPATAQTLGTAQSFSVLGGSSVSNTGLTILNGDLGVSPGSAITGFPPGTVIGTTYTGAASLAGTAHADVVTAYAVIVGEPFTINLTGQDLGGLTLTPGVYHFDTSAQLTGNLSLDPLGDPNAAFHFQIGSTLTTGSFSAISLVGGASTPNIFWQIGSSATLGIGTAFEGNILALTSITLNTGAGISNGRALAINGGVTLDSNNINNGGAALAPTPIGTYWKGGISNLWSQQNWSPDTTGAVNQNIPVSGANVIFSVTGVMPANQNTLLDMNQDIASLTINDSAAVSIFGPNTLTISGAGPVTGITVNSGAGLVTMASDVILAGASRNITVNNAAGLVISGDVGGVIGLLKDGAGMLTLTGANSYTGPTDVMAGTLQLGNGLTGSIAASSAVSVAPGATLLINLVNGGVFSSQVDNDGQLRWIAPGSNSQASTSVISGTGSMVITSPATTTLLGTNTFSGGTTINTPGTVVVGNPSAITATPFGTGALTLQQGNVDTVNAQVLQINVGGYAQSGGEIRLHLQGTTLGSYTHFNVAGNASLTGGTVFVYDDSGLYVPQGGDTQNIIRTTGGLTGSFASNAPFSRFYNSQFNQTFNYHQGDTLLYPTVTYDPSNAYITWVKDPYASVPGLTGNQSATAEALDGFHNLNPGSAAITYLNGQNIARLPALYDLIAPDEMTAIFQSGFHAAEIQTASIQQHLQQVRNGARNAGRGDVANDTITSSAGGKGVVETAPVPAAEPPLRRWNLWFEGLGGGATVSRTANASGYDFSSGGAMMGADYLVNDYLAVGVTGGYTHTDASLINGGSIQTNSYRSAVFATLFGGGFYVDGIAGAAYNSYETERAALLGLASGSTNGLELSGALNGGYDFHAGNWTFGPIASLAYTRVSLQGFTETGSLTPLTYPDQSQHSLRSNLGARIGYTTVFNNGMRFTPQVRLSWQHEFLDSTQAIDSTFGAGPLFTVNGPEIGRDSALIHAGFHLQITPAVSAYTYYGGQLGRDNYRSHNVTIGVQISF